VNPGASDEQPIPLAVCFDEAYAVYAAVTIASVLQHADARHRLYCVYSGAPERFPPQIAAMCAEAGCELVVLEAPAERFATWRVDAWTHFSAANYYRLALPELLPEDRFIYLDCDLIVTCGLSELYGAELGGAWIGGRADPLAGKVTQMVLEEGEPYLNSGVLVVDAASLRRHRPLDVIADYYAQHRASVSFVDQCLINKFAEGKKLIVPDRWNVLLNDQSPAGCERLIRDYEGQGVLHFNGAIKPWMEWAPSRSIQLWTRYAYQAGIDAVAAFVKARTTQQVGKLALRQEAEGDWHGAAVSWRKIAVCLDKELQKARGLA
jgi:lipopolysaccharide biosynthesis glycosyltransferase